MITRLQVVNTVDKLPEQFTTDELIDKLIFIDKIERGIEQSETGNVNTNHHSVRLLNDLPKLVK
jgi:hypothetical protein